MKHTIKPHFLWRLTVNTDIVKAAMKNNGETPEEFIKRESKDLEESLSRAVRHIFPNIKIK